MHIEISRCDGCGDYIPKHSTCYKCCVQSIEKKSCGCVFCHKTDNMRIPRMCNDCYIKEQKRMSEEKQKNKEPLQLNLGCFNKPLPGFVNIDARSDTKADLVDDCAKLERFQPQTVDLIYASHILEHFKPQEISKVLSRWYDLLKFGGTLRLAVPDMMAAAKILLVSGDLDAVRTCFWGSGRHEYDYHYTGWTAETLTNDLMAVGFKEVKHWNWYETEPHNYVDDYSSAYWPTKHVEYKNGKIIKAHGILLSLNLEAYK